VREEVRAARLLCEGEHCAKPETDDKPDPGLAAVDVAQNEIERDERKARGRVRAGKAGRVAQRIGAIGEETDVRKAPPERLEIPRAIDVGEPLQEAREPVRECQGEHEIE